MNPPDPTALSSQASNLDCLFTEHNFFSKRATNTLLRQGIVTPRLLLMHTPHLLHDIKEFGPQLLLELKIGLEQQGWCLAETANERHVTLTRFLTIAFSKVSHPLSPLTLTQMVNGYGRITWNETEVSKAAGNHPYVQKLENGLYQFQLHLVDVPIRVLSPQPMSDPTQEIVLVNGKIILSHLWPTWIAPLKEQHQEVLFSCYGIQGEEPLTLQEVGEELDLTRERVRQIKEKTLISLGSPVQQAYWYPMHRLLSNGVQQANKLMAPREWDHWLDENVIWQKNETRPSLLRLLCDLFRNFHYSSRYDVATVTQITDDHLIELHKALKYILGQAGKAGLTGEQLILEIQQQLPIDIPADVCEPAFIVKAIDLFDRIGRRSDGRYVYLRKKARPKYAYAIAGLSWLGEPGTRLYEWELKLRQQFAKVAWIGQVRLTEADFMAMCQAIQEEAQAPNYFSKVVEGQPLLVPPAVFITTMVLSARYAEQYPEDSTDEFWHPYLRTVWGIEYTQAFYTRCKKRFNAVIPFLEETYGFEFPRMGKAERDVITPIFRHALIPRYMQSDFAKWLLLHWQHILAVATTPALLAAHLQIEPSLNIQGSHRLKYFIQGAATAETAAALITSMATAISFHLHDGESIDSIDDLLANTPIEQELWREMAQAFGKQKEVRSPHLHLGLPRVTWVWSLDRAELALRVQNIILPADSKLEGEPDRLVWLETATSDPLVAEIEVQVTAWRMKTRERLIQEEFFSEPDGPLNGKIVLLTDMDEVAVHLSVPPHPTNEIQFFRMTQQGAYGIPIDPMQISDGTWLVCAKQPLTFLDEENEILEPDAQLPVPYPLTEQYDWAAQITLNMPVTIKQASKEVLTLTQQGTQSAISQPYLSGINPIAGLSSQVQPIFADTQVSLTIEFGGERLLKQSSLWIQGQDGWRWQQTIRELYERGLISLTDDSLHLDLSQLLPFSPNLYTIEFRTSLQPIFTSPTQFAIVPNLSVDLPGDKQLYSPANPLQLVLSGLDESVFVRGEGIIVTILPSGCQQITWTDLRYEPRLFLHFNKVTIPLAWSVPRFMAWLEPKPINSFLTLEELHQTTLHTVSSPIEVDTFSLSVTGQQGRSFSLRRGRYHTLIGHSQLYDMVRLTQSQQTQVNLQVGMDSWPLFEVRYRPQLLSVGIEYDAQEQVILFSTGLKEAWHGKVRFIAESLTNPFAPTNELAQTTQLQDIHVLPASLINGVYLLRLEIDGAWISLDENRIRFTVGRNAEDLLQAQQLTNEIRNGQRISVHLAEEFVLWWAEVAETGQTELTSTTLYQLATIPTAALENFLPKHLVRLWTVLAALKSVHDLPRWIEAHGFLPAWLLLPTALIFKTVDHGFQLSVHPIQVLQGGLSGKGYGCWHTSPTEGASKEMVYVQWQPVSGRQIMIEAGLPEQPPADWATIDPLSVYGLYYCCRCGRLTGSTSGITPQIRKAHLHGHPSADLRDITQPAEFGGHRLLADFYLDRRSQMLPRREGSVEIEPDLPIIYLAEPPLTADNPILQPNHRRQVTMLLHELMQYGQDNTEVSVWASAARLLRSWNMHKTVSLLGEASFVVGVLIRTAAYDQQRFCKLLEKVKMSEVDAQNLLAELNRLSSAHLQWGMTWAELLMLHSPRKMYSSS